MGVIDNDLKKLIKFIASALLIALTIHMVIFYLDSKYNLETTEITFSGAINYDEYVRDKKIPDITSVKYTKHESGREIIAVGSGFERFEKIDILNGSLKSSIDDYAIVGEKIARELYTGNSIVGEKLDYMGKQYTVIGVERGSTNVYISYSYDVENISWDKKMILYSGGLDSNLGNNLLYSLSSDGNELLKVSQRGKKILLLNNIINLIYILCVIKFIINFVIPYFKKVIRKIIEESVKKSIKSGMQTESIKSKLIVYKAIFAAVSTVAAVFIIIHSVRGIVPIESIYVSDILNPQAYIDMVSRNIQKARTDLGWGLSSYERAYFLLSLMIIFLSLLYSKLVELITSLIEA